MHWPNTDYLSIRDILKWDKNNGNQPHNPIKKGINT